VKIMPKMQPNPFSVKINSLLFSVEISRPKAWASSVIFKKLSKAINRLIYRQKFAQSSHPVHNCWDTEFEWLADVRLLRV
jgi:hypothetical protein